MLLTSLPLLAHLSALGCILNPVNSQLFRNGESQEVLSNIRATQLDWNYTNTQDWGTIKTGYELCRTGTQQSPIGLTSNLLKIHSSKPSRISFNYKTPTIGDWGSNGFCPVFTSSHPNGDFKGLPSLTFDKETVYLASWHLHTPAEHTVDGQRSRAELHLVHYDVKGDYRAVVAVLIEPTTGSESSSFFASLPTYISYRNTSQVIKSVKVNYSTLLQEIGELNEFWSYKGSLTTPPCKQGLQWFVAKEVLRVSREQLVEILGACSYSTREQQEVWEHFN